MNLMVETMPYPSLATQSAAAVQFLANDRLEIAGGLHESGSEDTATLMAGELSRGPPLFAMRSTSTKLHFLDMRGGHAREANSRRFLEQTGYLPGTVRLRHASESRPLHIEASATLASQQSA
jgi:hypothetical protein